ncbi:unnamed protein product [Arabidopsis thaliana]|uniref:Uncharacterized protein n=1 Tax=Arabidopsis thaliana TaxID=3702 RepID=A0A654FDL7_ARATH|nr:unnamed protein product [Arabidopsis thaliana]
MDHLEDMEKVETPSSLKIGNGVEDRPILDPCLSVVLDSSEATRRASTISEQELLRDRRSGNADILLALGLMEECDLIVEGNTANRGASLIALWRAYGPDSFGGFTQVICNRYPHNDQLEMYVL